MELNERKIYPHKQRLANMSQEEFDDWLTTEGWDLIAHNKYRSVYQNYYKKGYTLYANFPGFDGNKYQMYLFKGDYNPEFQNHKVFSAESEGLISIYEALAKGFSYTELRNDLDDIKHTMGRLGESFDGHHLTCDICGDELAPDEVAYEKVKDGE